MSVLMGTSAARGSDMQRRFSGSRSQAQGSLEVMPSIVVGNLWEAVCGMWYVVGNNNVDVNNQYEILNGGFQGSKGKG